VQNKVICFKPEIHTHTDKGVWASALSW